MTPSRSGHSLPGLVVGVLAAVAGLLVRFPFQLGEYAPYTTFYPAVTLTALLYGLRAGLLATATSAVLALWWIVPPAGLFVPLRAPDAIGVFLFCSTGMIISFTLELYHRREVKILAYEKELATRESEARFRTLADNISQLAWMADEKGRISWYNERFHAFTGTTLEEMQDRGWEKVIDPDYASAAIERMGHSFQAGQPWEDTFPLRGRAGEYRWFLSRAIPIKNERDDIVRWFGTSTDITDLRAVHQALRDATAEAERRAAEAEEGKNILQALMEHVPEGITIADAPDIRIRMVSRHGEELLGTPHSGLTPEEVVSICAVFHADGVTPMEPQDLPLVRAIQRGEVVQGAEVVQISATGRRLPLLCNSGPIRDREGRVVGGVVAWRDISDRKQIEKALGEHAARLEEAYRDLESFSYSVSHDLRAPLRGIRGFGSLLSEALAEGRIDEGREYLEHIELQAVRMGRLIDDLLRFSRVGSEKMELGVVDMNALVSEAWEELRAQAGDRVVELELSSLPAALGDGPLLRQVVANLLDNALKYTGPRERAVIEVWGERCDGLAHYHVRDNGVGFEEKAVHRLFRVFSRLHSEAEFPGTGVGLASVMRIVKRHGGEIRAEARRGAGATFHFTLPVPPPATGALVM